MLSLSLSLMVSIRLHKLRLNNEYKLVLNLFNFYPRKKIKNRDLKEQKRIVCLLSACLKIQDIFWNKRTLLYLYIFTS